ncbi:MAG TPA: hypothetical protein VME41_01485 [Stellaceae bacterium]|nr:hypothetical protein [Stellaceae bacterium]
MAGSGPSILAVAGDSRERAAIASTISEAGFVVAAVAEPFGALAALADRQFAALVSALPWDDGDELLRRARRQQPGLPMVLVLAPAALHVDETDSIMIVKRPLDPRQLLGCVFELVLRDAGASIGLGSRVAELGIAAAQLACLDHRRTAAARSGRGCLARRLTRQIGQVRSACRGLAGA